MQNYKEISPKELQENAFKLIGKDWTLVTSESDGIVNTMTASWGGMGVMWAKNVAFIVLRPQRYTKELVDSSGRFSLTFYEEEYRKTLNYLGTVSGRNENKIDKSGLSLSFDNGVPYFKEARLAMFCKCLYAQEYTSASFIDEKLIDLWYPKSDFHTMYIAEIEKIILSSKS